MSALDGILAFVDEGYRAPQARVPTEQLPRVKAIPSTCECGRITTPGKPKCSTCQAKTYGKRENREKPRNLRNRTTREVLPEVRMCECCGVRRALEAGLCSRRLCREVVRR